MSRRAVARSLGLAQRTVSKYLNRARRAGLSWPSWPELDDDIRLENRLFPPPSDRPSDERPHPDWTRVHRGLRLPNATLILLWEEYCDANSDSFSYAWFCERYRDWPGRLKPILRQVHLAHMAHRKPPHRHPIHSFQTPKGRTYQSQKRPLRPGRFHSGMVGDFISERWATSNRNGGRFHFGSWAISSGISIFVSYSSANQSSETGCAFSTSLEVEYEGHWPARRIARWACRSRQHMGIEQVDPGARVSPRGRQAIF
ncbi:hypothetical protein [Bradyrhizobium sp. CB3481]|uniref:hypothetical protein n=1 Tax=Bradyrhizobium sp. CB3481 TaxID=3039158 RepID=UPI0024B1411C|nr:hypothetical protein [Bradyrhizobium sp. CB3481]WFU14644.1 hypothetical protein QA643_26625 [Bradyrhizobium sp. CB3481]